MSHSSMSINQIIQQSPISTSSSSTTSSPPLPSSSLPTSSVNQSKLTGKVKIFYTFKGSDTHCLCTFDLELNDIKDKKWVSVPLKQCLVSVCSSCPDQLVDSNTAVYSANFEESKTVENWSPLHNSRSDIIWEGHGLLSNILSDDHSSSKSQVTGKIANDSNSSTTSNKYDCIIEVLVQLHPIRHSPVLQHNEQQQQQQQQHQQQYLPPMRSIWSEPMSNNYASSSPPSNNHTSSNNRNNESNSPPLILERPSPQRPHSHQLHHLPFPSNGQQLQQQRDDTHPRLHSYSSPSAPRDMMMKDEHNKMYPPAMDPSWPGSRYEASSFDHEMIKRRKLSSNSNHSMTTTTTTATAAAVADLRHYTSSAPSSTVTLQPTSASKVLHRNNSSHLTSATTTLISTSPTTDTYYHQSRRKKRDTKPPNANDVRPFIEIEKTEEGKYVLPAEVDSWTVLDLGSVIWDRAAFHNQRYIYPVGYRVKKWYRSMVDPHSDTQYTCEILDGGDEPIFQLNADDNPSECWRGPTPTTVWTIAVRRAFAIRNMDYGHNPVGPDFFGLRKNTIAKMIQDLPNADKCKNYIWQNFEAMSNSKGKLVRRSNTRLSSSSSTGSLNQAQSTTMEESTASPPSKNETS